MVKTGSAGGMPAIRVLAGPLALRHIREHGLRPADIAAVAGAAGGPKGLALLPLDRFLFGHWLPSVERERWLVGASIGAWRMAAAAQRDPLPALARLEYAYLEMQRYPAKPSAAQVAQVCRAMTRLLIDGEPARFLEGSHPQRRLQVVTARARGASARSARSVFAKAAIANTLARPMLGRHLQRVVFGTATSMACPAIPADRFDSRTFRLDAGNLEDALLASGTIPLIADPVAGIADAPPGNYWDGGLIDYHLHWRWQALEGIVLMPHFVPWVTAGWLDKFLPWRRHGAGREARGWLDNLLIIAPSPALLARLPNGKLPDRGDFKRYGLEHERRIADWRRAIADCEAMADDFGRFVQDPAGWPVVTLG